MNVRGAPTRDRDSGGELRLDRTRIQPRAGLRPPVSPSSPPSRRTTRRIYAPDSVLLAQALTAALNAHDSRCADRVVHRRGRRSQPSPRTGSPGRSSKSACGHNSRSRRVSDAGVRLSRQRSMELAWTGRRIPRRLVGAWTNGGAHDELDPGAERPLGRVHVETERSARPAAARTPLATGGGTAAPDQHLTTRDRANPTSGTRKESK